MCHGNEFRGWDKLPQKKFEFVLCLLAIAICAALVLRLLGMFESSVQRGGPDINWPDDGIGSMDDSHGPDLAGVIAVADQAGINQQFYRGKQERT